MSNENNGVPEEKQLEETKQQKRIATTTAIGLLVMVAAMGVVIGFLLDIRWWAVLLLVTWATLSCGGGILLAKKAERNRNDWGPKR